MPGPLVQRRKVFPPLVLLVSVCFNRTICYPVHAIIISELLFADNVTLFMSVRRIKIVLALRQLLPSLVGAKTAEIKLQKSRQTSIQHINRTAAQKLPEAAFNILISSVQLPSFSLFYPSLLAYNLISYSSMMLPEHGDV